MTGDPDPKPGHRRTEKNPAAMRAWTASHYECVACGEQGANAHHVLERDDGGDDVPENLVTVCGSGTSRCHGALHGNTYVVEHPRIGTVRRDREWVAWRIGRHLVADRPDTIRYVIEKLGDVAGKHYLLSRYNVRPEEVDDAVESAA